MIDDVLLLSFSFFLSFSVHSSLILVPLVFLSLSLALSFFSRSPVREACLHVGGPRGDKVFLGSNMQLHLAPHKKRPSFPPQAFSRRIAAAAGAPHREMFSQFLLGVTIGYRVCHKPYTTLVHEGGFFGSSSSFGAEAGLHDLGSDSRRQSTTSFQLFIL